MHNGTMSSRKRRTLPPAGRFNVAAAPFDVGSCVAAARDFAGAGEWRRRVARRGGVLRGWPFRLRPRALAGAREDAKRFDILVLNAQLSLLRGKPFERQRKRVMKIAGLLEDQQTIPVIAEQLELILEVRTDEWWVDVTYPMLEEVRKRLSEGTWAQLQWRAGQLPGRTARRHGGRCP